MNRIQKIGKLSHAVKAWRGANTGPGTKWLRQPQPSAARRVRRWLDELGLDADPSMKQIEAFSSYAQFSEWLRGL